VRRPHQESRQEDQNINESIVLKLVLIMQTGLNWLGICLIMNSGRSQSPCQSYCAIDGRSVSQYVLALSRSGTHDPILAVVKTDVVLFVMGRPPW